jgi:co-chaperonin GroES (HSP10)
MIAIGRYIVIRTIEEEVRTDSGILLSANDAAQFRYKVGVVVTPGTDVVSVFEGDKIYYDKSHSYTMLINEEQFTIIQEKDIVVVTNR